MFQRQYADGDVIYSQGDTADAVFLVLSGRVTLRRKDDPTPARIVNEGEAFGRTGIIRGKPRQFSAVATGIVDIALIRRVDLLDRLERNPDLWFPSALEALQTEAVAKLTPPATALVDEIRAALPEALAAPSPRVRLMLFPQDDRSRQQIDAAGLVIDKLPYRVGRVSTRSRVDGLTAPADLTLRDKTPYTLSRRHFSIDAGNDNRFLIRDDGSHHGTIVNGQTLGRNGRNRTAVLRPGENEIVAGTATAGFRFLLRISRA